MKAATTRRLRSEDRKRKRLAFGLNEEFDQRVDDELAVLSKRYRVAFDGESQDHTGTLSGCAKAVYGLSLDTDSEMGESNFDGTLNRPTPTLPERKPARAVVTKNGEVILLSLLFAHPILMIRRHVVSKLSLRGKRRRQPCQHSTIRHSRCSKHSPKRLLRMILSARRLSLSIR